MINQGLSLRSAGVDISRPQVKAQAWRSGTCRSHRGRLVSLGRGRPPYPPDALRSSAGPPFSSMESAESYAHFLHISGSLPRLSHPMWMYGVNTVIMLVANALRSRTSVGSSIENGVCDLPAPTWQPIPNQRDAATTAEECT